MKSNSRPKTIPYLDPYSTHKSNTFKIIKLLHMNHKATARRHPALAQPAAHRRSLPDLDVL